MSNILAALIPYRQLLLKEHANVSVKWKELYKELYTYSQVLAHSSEEDCQKLFTSDLERDLFDLLKGSIHSVALNQESEACHLKYCYRYLIHAKYQLSHAILFAIADLHKKGADNIHIVVDDNRLSIELFHALKAKSFLITAHYTVMPPIGWSFGAKSDLAMFVIDVANLLFEGTPDVQLLFYIMKCKRNKFCSLKEAFKASKFHGISLSFDSLKEHTDFANNQVFQIIDESFLKAKSLSSRDKVHLWFEVLQQLTVFYDENEETYIAKLYESILYIISDHDIDYFLEWLVLNITELEKNLHFLYLTKVNKTIQFVKSAYLGEKSALIVADIDYNASDFSVLNDAISQAEHCYFINSDYNENINNITDIILAALELEAEILDLKDLLQIENIPTITKPLGLTITKDLLPVRLFATSIGLLMKNPRDFFIQHILRLRPIDEFGRVPLKKMIGISMHKAIEQASIHKSYDIWIAKLFDSFFDLTKDAMEEWDAKYYHHIILPEVAGGIISKLNLEVLGHNEHYISCDLNLANDYKISIAMIVDRLELTGDIAKVIDYKTGIIPSNIAVLLGLEPQLLLAKFILQDEKYGIFNCDMSYIKVLPRVSDKDVDVKHMCYNIQEQLQILLNHYFVEENSFV